MQKTFATLDEVFLHQTRGPLKDKTYLLYKTERGGPYRSMTFGEFGRRTEELARAMYAHGVRKGDRIALVSESRPEWVMTDFAALLIGAVTVPMFPTLTAKQVEYILVDSGATVAMVSNDLQFGKVARSSAAASNLQTVVHFNEVLQSSLRPGIPVQSLKEYLGTHKDNAEVFRDDPGATPEDIVTIIYTSGTTGEPKGVMLTHENLLSNIVGALTMLPPLTPEDVFLSFLPLSHSFERIASYLKFYVGLSVAYAESIDTVAENMMEVRPTVMTGVPRFYERVYGRVMRMRDTLPERRRKVFDWALRVGAKTGQRFEGLHVPTFARMAQPVADKLVLRKIRARTGGRIRFFVSGGAALPAEVGRAFSAFGLPIVEGYGMTECSPIISVNKLGKIKWGTVGTPLPNVQVMISNEGEILTRGPHVMKSYYNDPAATTLVIDDDGWLHTGDVGEMDGDGYITITDRLKHLIVSNGGKNIAPGPIESLITQSRYIDQVMLVGDKRQYCTALVVPDFETLREDFAARGIPLPDSIPEIANDDKVFDLIHHEIDRLQKDLASFERIRRFALLAEPFTIENAMMTPTLKIKRNAVEGRYKELIETLYHDVRRTYRDHQESIR